MALQEPIELLEFDKYVAAEKEYAELRGWKDVQVLQLPPFDMPFSHPPKIVLIAESPKGLIPQWARNNNDSFELAVENGIWVKEWSNRDGTIEIEAKYLLHDRFPTYYTTLADHDNDKQAAFRYAILLAAIGRSKKMQ